MEKKRIAKYLKQLDYWISQTIADVENGDTFEAYKNLSRAQVRFCWLMDYLTGTVERIEEPKTKELEVKKETNVPA